jgi:hypothetical protein
VFIEYDAKLQMLEPEVGTAFASSSLRSEANPHLAWSQRTDLNRQPLPYEGIALPLSHAGQLKLFSEEKFGKRSSALQVELPLKTIQTFSFAPFLFSKRKGERCGAGEGVRTLDFFLGKEASYHYRPP